MSSEQLASQNVKRPILPQKYTEGLRMGYIVKDKNKLTTEKRDGRTQKRSMHNGHTEQCNVKRVMCNAKARTEQCRVKCVKCNAKIEIETRGHGA
jgi:hypothetical protein